jgi:hypothetical protein
MASLNDLTNHGLPQGTRCGALTQGTRFNWRGTQCTIPAVVARQEEEIVYTDDRRYNEETFKFETERSRSLKPVTRYYCGTHDPVRKAERDAKKHAEGLASQARRERTWQTYNAAAERLGAFGISTGVATVQYGHEPRIPTGVSVGLADIDQIVEALALLREVKSGERVAIKTQNPDEPSRCPDCGVPYSECGHQVVR